MKLGIKEKIAVKKALDFIKNTDVEKLLKEYQEEYKTFFEEKKKVLEAYRIQSNRQIENNERLIRELDRLISLFMSQNGRKTGTDSAV